MTNDFRQSLNPDSLIAYIIEAFDDCFGTIFFCGADSRRVGNPGSYRIYNTAPSCLRGLTVSAAWVIIRESAFARIATSSCHLTKCCRVHRGQPLRVGFSFVQISKRDFLIYEIFNCTIENVSYYMNDYWLNTKWNVNFSVAVVPTATEKLYNRCLFW